MSTTTACSAFRPLSWDPGLCACGAMAEMHEPTVCPHCNGTVPVGMICCPTPATPTVTDRQLAGAPVTIEDAELPTGVRMIDAMNRALFPSLFPGVEAPKR